MCIFCNIIDGTVPTSKIYEDEIFCIFEDINPKADNHFLAVPKIHIENLYDLDSTEKINAVQYMIKEIPLVIKTLNISHFKLIVNNGAASGQEVFHLHFHLLSGSITV